MTTQEILSSLAIELGVAGKSASTCVTYIGCVRYFGEYLDKPLTEVDRSDVARFMTHLARERHLTPSTVKTYVCALLFLFRVVLGRANVVVGLKTPRVTPPLAVVLSPEEVTRLLAAFRSPMYVGLSHLLYGTGMRLGEALSVTVEDIDAARGVIRVQHTKTRRPRVVRLSKCLLEVLRNYWREVRPPRPLLFPGRNPTQHLNTTSVTRAFRRAASDAGINKPVTPHVLRHSYATHLIEGGVDIHTVQLLLGHASLDMTLRYLHLSTAHLAGRRPVLSPLLGVPT